MPYERANNSTPPGFKLRHALRGHRDYIFSIAWAPDGKKLASGSLDGAVLLWGAETGKLLARFEGLHVAWIKCVAWSPDGRTLAAGSKDGSIRLWDAGTGGLLHTLEGHFGTIHGVAWSPDGQTFASASEDKSVRLWDAGAGALLHTLEGHFDPVRSVAWSPDGRVLASGSLDKTIRLWEAKTGRLRRRLEGSSKVFSVGWSPDGQILASGGLDKTVQLWDPKMGKLKVTLEGHTGTVLSVSFSHDGQHLASKALDATVLIWRRDTWEKVSVLEENVSHMWPSGLAFHPKAPVLATLGERDGVIHIWDMDFEVIISSAPKQENVLYTTAKITLVGDSGVGKTGLGWRLAQGEFKEHPSTHGQQFWVISELGATRADGTQCEAVLWDLAGQPDYRLVHALFLDEVDLALVLFDPTNQQEPLKGVEYWLGQLARERRDGRKRRVILVGARADRGVPTITEGELNEFCKGQCVEGGYISTSALMGEGLKELVARIKASIIWDEMPATVTTATFKLVKEFVLSLKEDGRSNRVLVGKEQLRVRLKAMNQEWEFTDIEMMTAVRHLSTHGYVAVLRGSKGEETILLTPDLLTNLASSFVLEARRNEKGLGALDEARVLLGEYNFPEVASLGSGESDVLLDAAVILFLEHNLCFRETLGRQTLLIFPALINQKRPQIEELEKVDDFSYHLTGAVENVYASLVVQLGYTNTFTRTNQWQNQAEYETARGDVCGFRQVAEREGEVELVLYYSKSKPGARLLFQGLFEEFLRGRDVTITKFPPVACPGCGYWQQRAEVVKRVREGKGFLYCGECSGRITLPKVGEEVTLSLDDREQLGGEQKRARDRTTFEAALVRVKAVVRDEGITTPSCFLSYAWGEPEQERWVRELANNLENAGVEVVYDQKDNQRFGTNIARFISRIVSGQVDFIIAVGTPNYLRKYENEVSTSGSIVAAEVNLINLRLTRTNSEAETVLPLLLEGSEESSLPPLLRGKFFADFRREINYFVTLFDLILTLYRIPFNHPAVSDLRESRMRTKGWGISDEPDTDVDIQPDPEIDRRVIGEF